MLQTGFALKLNKGNKLSFTLNNSHHELPPIIYFP